MSRLDGEQAVIVPNKYLSSRGEGVRVDLENRKSMRKNYTRILINYQPNK